MRPDRRPTVPRWVRGLALAAGVSDAATGLGLLLAPQWVLHQLAVPPVVEPVFLRWIGAFVGSVGVAYLYPFLLAARSPAPAAALGFALRLRVVLEQTALARAAVAATVGAAIAAGALAPAWLGVAAFDGVLALLQGWWLVRSGPLEAQLPGALEGGR
jgi:hypothetical protein